LTSGNTVGDPRTRGGLRRATVGGTRGSGGSSSVGDVSSNHLSLLRLTSRLNGVESGSGSGNHLREDILLAARMRRHAHVSVEDGGVVSHGSEQAGLLGHPHLLALGVLGLKMPSAILLALSKSDIDGLGAEHLSVHLSHSLGGLILRSKADESKSLGNVSFLGNLGRGDVSEGAEFSAESDIINGVIEVLDEQVGSLELGGLGLMVLLVFAVELFLPFVLLLEATDEELLSIELKFVQLLASLLSLFVGGVINVTEALGDSILILLNHSGADDSVLAEKFAELFIIVVFIKVLDENVGEGLLQFFRFGRALSPGNVVTDKDLLLVKEHSIHGVDGQAGRLRVFKVDETETTRVSILINHDLARQDVSKVREGVMKSLVINRLLQVLDEDVSLSGFAEGGVSLRPHEAANTLSVDGRVVEGIQGELSILKVVEVNVSIQEGPSGDNVTADTNGSDSLASNLAEGLVEVSLGDIRSKTSNVERSRGTNDHSHGC